jgi:Ca-activated chloride channel family protein
VTNPDGIGELVRGYREKNIFLTAVGVGMGNHNDALMERLADAGNGQCVYVDRLEEAHRVFAENLMGTLETIAQDVKIQVAFDTSRVVMYRQLGYENRAVADQDFRNDAVDAGEVGAGHEVTALYEILPLAGAGGRLATVTIRYKPVEGSAVGAAVEQAAEVLAEKAYPTFEVASPRFRLAAVVAEFAEILRQSYWARGSTLEGILAQAEPLAGAFPGEVAVAEFVALVKQAQRLMAPPASDELADAVETLKENTMLRAKLARLEHDEGLKEVVELKQQNEDLKRRIRLLLERRLEK